MKTLIALAVSGLLATGAMADGDKKETEKQNMKANAEFSKLDTNHDSSLNKTEAAINPKLDVKGFTMADTNKDDKLSREEFIAWSQAEDMGKEYSSAPVKEESVKDEPVKDDDEDIQH